MRNIFKKKEEAIEQEIFKKIGSLFKSANRNKTDEKKRKEWREFNHNYKLAFRDGLTKGLQASMRGTSELSDKEHKLLLSFLVKHGFILCYDLSISGFRVRKNTNHIIQEEVMEREMPLMSEHECRYVETGIESCIDYELELLEKELEAQKPKLEDIKILEELATWREQL